MRFKPSYVSEPFLSDGNPSQYVFGKQNGSIIADVDRNGFLDIVTFPSEFTEPVPVDPIVWLNSEGIFTATKPANPGGVFYQYIRNSAEGDFDNDGYLDFFLADQGWELEGRNPEFFAGALPKYLKGSATGLEFVAEESWVVGEMPTNTFHHISSVADFDQDGDLDVGIAEFWSGYRLYVNDGNGNFELRKDLVPNDYNAGAYSFGSGTSFIKLGDEYAIVIGFYRQFSIEDVKPNPVVLTMQDGVFDTAYSLEKPDLGGREINYGASDMYNVDLNGDQREDLIICWETEALGGIDDGSVIEDAVYSQETRYADLSNTIVTVWFQDENGLLVKDKKTNHYDVYPEKTSGGELRFTDLNNDGFIDFYVKNYGSGLDSLHKVVWLNDGSGQFSNPDPSFFQLSETLPDWYEPTPYFFDANNDGVVDIVTVRAVFDGTYYYRNIGEEVRVFLGEGEGGDLSYAYGRYADSIIDRANAGVLNVFSEEVGTQHFAGSTRIKFVDVSVAFDLDGATSAGGIYRLYKATFNREPDTGGLGYWIAQADAGNKDAVRMAEDFTWSQEFQDLYKITTTDNYGTGTDVEALVTGFYENVLGRTPDQGGLDFYTGVIESKERTVGRVLAEISDSQENYDGTIELIANGIVFDPWVG